MPWVPSWGSVSADAVGDDTAARANLISAIDAWAGAVAISGVPESFGWRCTAAAGEALLDQLEGLGSMYWDFRAGRERNLARTPQLTEGQARAITDAAPVLGLAGTEAPRRRHYDALVMTGGMVRAGVVKPRFARELVDAGHSFGEVVFLGAFRTFAGDEVRLARELGIDGGDEWHAMVAGVGDAFGRIVDSTLEEEAGENRNAAWRDLAWRAGGQAVRVVAAPSSAPDARRADTADTFRFWAERVGASGRSILVATTPIYVPYQAAVAVSVLGVEAGLEVETVAVSDSANELGEHTQLFEPQHHLQELLSAVRGMRSLRNDLVSRHVNRRHGAVR